MYIHIHARLQLGFAQFNPYTHTEDSRNTHDVFQVAFRAMIDKCFDVRFEFRGTMMIKAIEINGRVAPELLDSLSGK